MDDYINYLVSVGADKIPHYHEGDSLLSHCIRVSGMLYSYGRPMYEVSMDYFIPFIYMNFKCIKSMLQEMKFVI